MRSPRPCIRVVVLESQDGLRQRRYPMTADWPLQETYVLGGETWRVVADIHDYRPSIDRLTLAARGAQLASDYDRATPCALDGQGRHTTLRISDS